MKPANADVDHRAGRCRARSTPGRLGGAPRGHNPAAGAIVIMLRALEDDDGAGRRELTDRACWPSRRRCLIRPEPSKAENGRPKKRDLSERQVEGCDVPGPPRPRWFRFRQQRGDEDLKFASSPWPVPGRCPARRSGWRARHGDDLAIPRDSVVQDRDDWKRAPGSSTAELVNALEQEKHQGKPGASPDGLATRPRHP